jgi:hypothetical protein
MTHRQKRIFFNWLQKQGVLKQYKRNRFAYSHKCHTRANSYALMPFRYAMDAFTWRHTPEGYGFWLHLDHVWTLFAIKSSYDT